jgi:di/tricarboxylate transporter
MGITFAVLAGIVVLFVWNRFPVEMVALGAALTLYATDVLRLDQTLAGFGDPAVILIASLFVVSEGLDSTGVTTWAGQALIARVGQSRERLLILVILLVALLTALISVNGAVAALLPMVVILALRTGNLPSQVLMPLAFGAHAGSMLALTGTPVNVLVSEAADEAGAGEFNYFSFALVGVPLVAGTIAIVVLFGAKLLPNRTPQVLSADLSAHARTLSRQYLDDHRVFRLAVEPASPFVGRNGADLPFDDHIELVGVQVGGAGKPARPTSIDQSDVLIVRGDPDAVAGWSDANGLRFADAPFVLDGANDLMDRRLGVAEVVIPPRSGLVDVSVFPGMVTDSGDLVILAVQRQGEDRGARATTLQVGDTLLLQGEWTALGHHVGTDPDVLVVDRPDRVRRQAVPMGPGSKRAVTIVAAMVVLLATGAVPAVIAGLLAAMAMVLTGVLTPEQSYRGISWTTIVLVGAMIPLSTAMTESGAAERVATELVDAVGDSSPYLLLLALFLLTAILGQLISNMATALIVIPIAASAAAELDISVRPVMMSVTVAAAAALLTPVATPANLMVMGPAGYKFGDYWKLGLVLLCLYGAVSVLLVPVIWSF